MSFLSRGLLGLTLVRAGDSLRRQTRETENALEQQLTAFSKHAATASTSYSSSGLLSEDTKASYGTLERQVEEGLTKVSSSCPRWPWRWTMDNSSQLNELVDGMFKLLDDTPTASTAMNHTAIRHREILADYTRDFKRTQVRRSIYDGRDLFDSVHRLHYGRRKRERVCWARCETRFLPSKRALRLR